VPEFISVSKLDRTVIAEAIAEMGPVVIKPACGEFSQGVRYFEHPDEFNDCEYQNTIANARRAGFALKDGPWLIERYTEGAMLSIEGVVMKGIVHILGRVANEMGPLPDFEIVSNRLPAPLNAGEQVALDAAASAAACALGDGPGFFHCELRLCGAKATVIEIAARVPGGLLPDAYQRAFGLDLYRIQLDLWNGRAPDLGTRSRFHILQKACYAPPDSRISRMAGAEVVGGIDGLWQFRAFLASGQVTGDAKQVKIPAYYYGVESLWPERLDVLARQVEDGIGLIHEPLCTDGRQTG
jgi:biotin carboxylase